MLEIPHSFHGSGNIVAVFHNVDTGVSADMGVVRRHIK